MVKIRIDGVEYEVSEQVAQAIARGEQRRAADGEAFLPTVGTDKIEGIAVHSSLAGHLGAGPRLRPSGLGRIARD